MCTVSVTWTSAVSCIPSTRREGLAMWQCCMVSFPFSLVTPPTKHSPFGVCGGSTLCPLWGTSWIFVFHIDLCVIIRLFFPHNFSWRLDQLSHHIRSCFIIHEEKSNKMQQCHSFSSLSYDRSEASSKASSPHSAIQSFLFQMRVSSYFLKVIQ